MRHNDDQNRRARWATEIHARLTHASLSPAREAEIVDELSQHLDDRWRSLVASGLSPEDAERAALSCFTGSDVLGKRLAPLKQAHWTDHAPPPASAHWLQGLAYDFSHAARGLRSSPAFTVVALIVLMLGIGATTAIFSVVDAVVLRALPFDQADRLVALGETTPPGKGPAGGKGPQPSSPRPPLAPGFMAAPSFGAGDPQALGRIKPQNYFDWVAGQQVFEGIAAIASNDATLFVPAGEPEDLPIERVTAGLFDVLRIRPALGRAFTADDEVPGRDRVAILSNALWRRKFWRPVDPRPRHHDR